MKLIKIGYDRVRNYPNYFLTIKVYNSNQRYFCLW